MKIAFIANTCWNIYNFRKGLVHHFLENGDEVLVLAPLDDYTRKVKEWGVKFIETPLEGTGTNPIKDFAYLVKIRHVFKNERPDVALSFTIKSNIYASLAGKWSGVPTICNVSGLGTVFLVRGIAGKVAMALYKFAFRFSSYVFFQNEDDKTLFTSKIKIARDKTGMLPGSGINLAHYRPTKFPNTDVVKFVMISRVIVEKGVREYAEAASHFAGNGRVKFTLVGKFDEGHSRSIGKEELDKWIKQEWIEYLPHTDNIMDVIGENHAVILPSYREGTSRTLLEGGALGRPLLTADVAGCREVVKDGFNGFLFEVRNAKSIVDKIKLFLSLTREEQEQLGTNSRILVEETYDERIVIDIYTETIRRIIH